MGWPTCCAELLQYKANAGDFYTLNMGMATKMIETFIVLSPSPLPLSVLSFVISQQPENRPHPVP